MNLSEENKLVLKCMFEDEFNEDDVIDKIKQFFKKNQNPSDEEVHSLANEYGIDKHRFEEVIYKMLHDALTGKMLKHSIDPDERYDEDELEAGIKIEYEHIDDYDIAKAIAKAHLAELPDYYTRLKEMENTAKNNGDFNE